MTLTLINWATRVWNPHLGCDKASRGCDGCYAIVNAWIRMHNPNAKIAGAYAGLVHRGSDGHLDWTGRINLLPERLGMPFTWPHEERVFVDSMSDFFHAGAPDGWIAQVLAVAAACPRHVFLIPTKRHGRMRAVLTSAAFRGLYEAEYARLLPTLSRKNRDQAPPCRRGRFPTCISASRPRIRAMPSCGFLRCSTAVRRRGFCGCPWSRCLTSST